MDMGHCDDEDAYYGYKRTRNLRPKEIDEIENLMNLGEEEKNSRRQHDTGIF